jgi:hypothetical protein
MFDFNSDGKTNFDDLKYKLFGFLPVYAALLAVAGVVYYFTTGKKGKKFRL